MKTLVKITAICALVLLTLSANAQIKVGVGGGIALPMGTFGDAYKMGFGGGVAGKYMLNENMALGLSIGYQMLSPTDELKAFYDGADVKFSIIPVAASFQYYFATEGFKPYAGIDLGYYTMKVKAEVEGFSVSASSSEIGFAPTVGFEYDLSEKMALDVNAKYNYIMTEGEASTMIGVNVGLLFSLGN